MKKQHTRSVTRLGSMLLALLMLTAVFSACLTPALAAEGVTVKLHYHRNDGKYDGWNLWFWPEGKDGAAYDLTEENGEMVATFPVPAGVTRIGFIVRKGEWESKDVDADQFIELPDVLRGTVHIYVESGVEGYTRVDGEDVVTGVLVSAVKYDYDAGTVNVTLTGKPSGDIQEAFTVNGPDGAIEFTASETSAGNYALSVPELDLTRDYTLIFDGTEYPITMPNIYSTDSFEAEYTYTGDDLGAVWTQEKTAFRLWAPTASEAFVNLYRSGAQGADDLIESLPMTAAENGTWTAEKSGDLNGTYYTFSVTVGGKTVEACDPYARTTGVNGSRAMVIDLASTDPDGWAEDKNPNADLGYTDAIIYELHVRDLSMDESSGIVNKGKFLGLTETGTVTSGGRATGIDHIKELGTTHIHLLPVYDFGSVDETRLDEPQFNWGYDPVNYNVPEGSYSTDPYNGAVRVSEMKQMVKALHDQGLSVIMDVVYNHVYNASEFCVNKLVPDYFSRTTENGAYSSGSGCGNDTASERSMVRKYIVDSVKYWCDEYHIDGFRFDLVGLLDTETINELVNAVHETRPDVIFYGEGWSMTTAVTKPGVELATQQNSTMTPGFAYFNDSIRDALKGSVFDIDRGFVSGAEVKKSSIEQSFLGKPIWCKSPAQLINYASCHDNNTLFDRIALSRTDASREDLIKMNNLAAAIYMTSQGVPFMQAGEELLRTKVDPDGTFNKNSYSAPDEVNSIKWSTLDEPEYSDVFEYYKGLIAFRKAHPVLRLTTAEDVKANVATADAPKGVAAFELKGGVNGEPSKGIFVIFNGTAETQSVTLPAGNEWEICVNGETAGTEVLGTASGTVEVAPISALILTKGEEIEIPENPDTQDIPETTETPDTPDTPETDEPANKWLSSGAIAAIAACTAAGLGAVAVAIGKKKKK